jgi:hypothetical protein
MGSGLNYYAQPYLAGAADLEHGDAAAQLREALLHLLAVVVAARVRDGVAQLLAPLLEVRPLKNIQCMCGVSQFNVTLIKLMARG